eukprot:sb/3466216/
MINGFIAIYLPVVSTLTILMITVHRALVVLNPFKANIVTKRGAVIACAFSWIWCLVVPVPPLLGINNYHYSADRGFCRINFVQNAVNGTIDTDVTRIKLANAFSMISVSLFVIVPLLVIVVLNFILLVTSWKLQLTIPQPQQPRRDSLRRKSTLLADQKAFRTVSLVVGAFLMCWLPQVLITFLGILLKDKLQLPPEVNTFQAILVMLNSTVNPFIYTYVNKDFRSRFVQILLCSAFNSHSTKSLNKQLSIRGNNGNYHPANDNYLDSERYRARHGSDNMNNSSRSETNYNHRVGSGATLSPVGRNGSSSSNGRTHHHHSSLELLPPIITGGAIKSGSTQNLTSADQNDQ